MTLSRSFSFHLLPQDLSNVTYANKALKQSKLVALDVEDMQPKDNLPNNNKCSVKMNGLNGKKKNLKRFFNTKIFITFDWYFDFKIRPTNFNFTNIKLI